jgi:iron complex transport system substrate-binding protein
MKRTPLDPSFQLEARGFRFLARMTLLAAVLALVAACAGGPAATLPAATPSATATFVATPTPAATPASFPVSVVDDEGTTVTIPAEPKRIATLTAASTETVFALGIGDRVVATASSSDYPAEAVPLPDVADFGKVKVEDIVGLNVDLVIAGGNFEAPADAIAKLRSFDIPVVVVYAATFDAVFTDIGLIARSVGQAAKGAEVVKSMHTEIDALIAAVASASRPRVFYEIDATQAIYGPADASFLAQMLGLAGCHPVTSGSGASYEISLEKLVAADPEVIVLGDAAFGTTADVVKSRPGWGSMTAVRRGDIRTVDDKLVTRPGPRLGQGLRSLILAIHPDAKLP